MTSYKQSVEATIRELKKGAFGKFYLWGTHHGQPFKLVFLTADCESDTHIISTLARWRKKHELWFPAQFPVSIARTRDWFTKRLIDAPDRLLFMISVRDTYIGHVGLFRFDYEQKSCEIDNIVRGGQGHPGIMGEAISVMMAWGRKTLKLSGYTLETTSDNLRALTLYARLGFVEVKREPVIYQKTTDGGQWVLKPAGYKKTIERYIVFMKRRNSHEL